MDNNNQHPPVINIILWITGFAYSVFSDITAEKLSYGMDFSIKALTIVSVSMVIRWHYLQIKRYKQNEKNDKKG